MPHLQHQTPLRRQPRQLIRLRQSRRDRLLHQHVHATLEAFTRDRVVRLLPPLILNKEEADQIVAILVPLIKAFNAK